MCGIFITRVYNDDSLRLLMSYGHVLAWSSSMSLYYYRRYTSLICAVGDFTYAYRDMSAYDENAAAFLHA